MNDPTGHRACGDGEVIDCDGHTQDPNANPYKPPKNDKDKNLEITLKTKDNNASQKDALKQLQFCLEHMFAPECQHNTDPSISSTPAEVIVGYKYKVNWNSIDWLHTTANFIGILGDAVTIAAFLDPLPVVDELAIGEIAAGANSIGVAIDAYDILQKNDLKGISIDTLIFLGQKTNAIKRIIPVLGLGVHIKGMADAVLPGIQVIPITAPAPINP